MTKTLLLKFSHLPPSDPQCLMLCMDERVTKIWANLCAWTLGLETIVSWLCKWIYASVPENIPLEPLSDCFATKCDCENANYSQITYHVEVAMLPGQIAQMQAQIWWLVSASNGMKWLAFKPEGHFGTKLRVGQCVMKLTLLTVLLCVWRGTKHVCKIKPYHRNSQSLSDSVSKFHHAIRLNFHDFQRSTAAYWLISTTVYTITTSLWHWLSFAWLRLVVDLRFRLKFQNQSVRIQRRITIS